MLLDEFDEFPQQPINIYSKSTGYDELTGEMTEGYTLEENKDVWIFQQSAGKNLFTDQILESIELILVTETDIDDTQLVEFDGNFYGLVHANNVLLSDEVTTIGLSKVDQPTLLDDVSIVSELLQPSIVGTL